MSRIWRPPTIDAIGASGFVAGWAWSGGDGPAGHSLSSALGVAAILSPLQGGVQARYLPGRRTNLG